MAHTVEIRSADKKQSPGYDGGGLAKNKKLEVVGEVNVTSYVRGGTQLQPTDVGLTTIDHMDLVLKEPMRGNSPRQALRRVHYSFSAQEFYISDHSRDDLDGPNEIAGASTATLTFHAWGDSVFAPELK
jgi:hypothetical protein